MTGTVPGENPRHQLADLRAQLLALADEVAPFATPPKPDKLNPATSTRKGGPVWAVPQHPKGGRAWSDGQDEVGQRRAARDPDR